MEVYGEFIWRYMGSLGGHIRGNIIMSWKNRVA